MKVSDPNSYRGTRSIEDCKECPRNKKRECSISISEAPVIPKKCSLHLKRELVILKTVKKGRGIGGIGCSISITVMPSKRSGPFR